MLPPDVDAFLCNESKGTADYKNPAGNSASGVFDPDTLLSGYEGSYMLIPRGHCTFEAKARSAQRLGAAGAIVRNTLDSRYQLINEDAVSTNYKGGPDWGNTKWPVEQRDYECGTHKASGHVGWRAEIETAALNFYPAPYNTNNDVLLTGPAVDGSLCAKEPNLENFEKHCPSQRCLLTGRNASDDGSVLEACCAWDTYLRMGSDGVNDGDAVPQEEEEEITIPALYVTMEHGEELYDVVVDAALQQGETVQFVNIVPYGRWYPSGHYSGVLIWVLALFTLWIAAYESAKEYRTSWKKISQAVNDGVLVFQRSATNSNATATGRRRTETEDTVDLAEENVEFELASAAAGNNGQNGGITTTSPGGSFSISDDAEGDDFVGNPSASPNLDDVATSNDEDSPANNARAPTDSIAAALSHPPTMQQQQPQRVNLQSRSTPTAAMQNLELNALHAVIFVVCASVFLFILFFFNLDKVIRVLYGLGGSVAMNQILFYPLYTKLFVSKFQLGGAVVSKKLQSRAFGNLPGCRGENFTWMDVVSSATGYALGIAWIVVGLTRVQPMTNVYYWLIQDVMGVCFCVLILGLIHINTIMVASVLLCLVFVYDIFHVLISPYIFGSSVMIDVATGSSSVDPSFCEKYPTDKACKGSFAPLPMLLAIPWFNDFRGGFSMLGLGDIILPGLLISFAARYDSAIALVRKCSQTSSIRSGGNVADSDETDLGGGGGEATNESSGSSSRRYHYHLGRVIKALFHGYFGPLMIAYAIGLMIAYIVVWTTKRGQPALLYLVPACLGTILFLGWRRRELSDLWSGPKVMQKANRMVGVASKIPEGRSATAREANNSLAETSTMV
mmetsp:Transcript_31204/g.57715  ORF Transcript_31204/g.57715 Transcript_31204/m.57715 type:complete len:845 (-) Transcript_31204:161-2695(-)